MSLRTLYRKFYREGLTLAPAALRRMADQRSKPPEPVMPQADYDAMPDGCIRKIMLCCNMPGCPHVVSTHGGLCVEHTQAMSHDD